MAKQKVLESTVGAPFLWGPLECIPLSPTLNPALDRLLFRIVTIPRLILIRSKLVPESVVNRAVRALPLRRYCCPPIGVHNGTSFPTDILNQNATPKNALRPKNAIWLRSCSPKTVLLPYAERKKSNRCKN